MAYNITGTAGNDTLSQSGDSGPGAIVGLAGNDVIFTGTGQAVAYGNSGNDIICLQPGNTGSVWGGGENDFIFGPPGSMVLFGNEGGDTVEVSSVSANETVVGGNDSADGADSIVTGAGADLILGNGGNDTIVPGSGANTVVGGFGNDSIFAGTGTETVWGNQGNDTILTNGGSDTVFAGQGNDSLVVTGLDTWIFGNEGNDTVDATALTESLTVYGGSNGADPSDGADSIETGAGADYILGGGGNDEIDAGSGANTVFGGDGNDEIFAGPGNCLIFGNQGNDLISTRGIYDIFPRDNSTVAGGQGDDHIVDGSLAQPTSGASVLQGNEDNDTIAGTGGVDTITGGDGRDVFEYRFSSDDGNNAAGGGPIERITDLNWAEDRFDVGVPVTFATDMTGRTTGSNLAAQADSAIAGAFALAGADPLERVAVQFAFNGRAYLAVDSAFGGVEGRFDDRDDVLLDITGVVGTISVGGFTFS